MGESKAWMLGLTIVMGTSVLIALIIVAYSRSVDLIDAAAPVVESCVKHPATRPPFRSRP
jgi:hypothetical protein